MSWVYCFGGAELCIRADVKHIRKSNDKYRLRYCHNSCRSSISTIADQSWLKALQSCLLLGHSTSARDSKALKIRAVNDVEGLWGRLGVHLMTPSLGSALKPQP